ncbi:MAG: methyltransferase protein [Arthrobacter sp.]|nr:methyltransferase protein [Arthrobacter sp.]
MLLRERALDAVEEMDLPDCNPTRLARTYEQFAVVNRAVSGWRSLYRTQLRPRLSAGSTTTLLDIGCGGGDLAVMLSRWAFRDGRRLAITAIDPDPRASRFAQERHSSAGVTFRQAAASELAGEGKSYDFVVSNHVLHHLGQDEFPAFLAESAALCHGRVIHNDLRRSPAAYALFFAGSLIFTGSYIRRDGLTSIRRSYTAAELASAAPPGWVVARHSPYRNLLILDRTGKEPSGAAGDATAAGG